MRLHALAPQEPFGILGLPRAGWGQFGGFRGRDSDRFQHELWNRPQSRPLVLPDVPVRNTYDN